MKGHHVALLEREAQLGGRARLNATHGWRPSWQAVNELGRELLATAPGLDVRLAGDARAPRNLDAARAEGALTGAAIA
jgi:hypothetical protein